MADTIFADGLKVFRPREGAPEWIKLNMVIDKATFTKWLNVQMGNEIRLDLKESKGGVLYVALNDYKKPTEAPVVPKTAPEPTITPKDEGIDYPENDLAEPPF